VEIKECLLPSVVAETMKNADRTFPGAGCRVMFYNKRENILVVYNPNEPDRGTVFRPKEGESYVDVQELKETYRLNGGE